MHEYNKNKKRMALDRTCKRVLWDHVPSSHRQRPFACITVVIAGDKFYLLLQVQQEKRL